MKKCTECDRPLKEDESALCPSCKSNKSHEFKKWSEIITGACLIVGGLVYTIFKDDKDGKST